MSKILKLILSFIIVTHGGLALFVMFGGRWFDTTSATELARSLSVTTGIFAAVLLTVGAIGFIRIARANAFKPMLALRRRTFIVMATAMVFLAASGLLRVAIM